MGHDAGAGWDIMEEDGMPRFSIGDCLRIVGPSLPQELVPKPSIEYMERIADLLPGLMTGLFGFECRLKADAMQADFFVRVRPERGEHEILADRRSDAQLPRAFWREPVWQGARDFCDAWADPTGALHGKIGSVWLEFDLEGPPPEVPIPCIFFASRHIRSQQSSGTPSCDWVTREALRRLTGADLPRPQEEMVRHCIRRLPPGTCIFVIGAMTTRAPAFVRVAIRGLQQDQIAPYLDSVGWPGDPAAVERLTAEMKGIVDQVDLNLDVSERVGAKAGLECSFVPKRDPAHEPRWHSLLDDLVERGLCTAEKRAALLRYPGSDDERSAAEQWPEALLNLSERMGPKILSTLSRGLVHTKLVYEPGRPLEAKAYLAVRHLWTPIE